MAFVLEREAVLGDGVAQLLQDRVLVDQHGVNLEGLKRRRCARRGNCIDITFFY
jgi:hypothetical protein